MKKAKISSLTLTVLAVGEEITPACPLGITVSTRTLKEDVFWQIRSEFVGNLFA